MATNAPINSPRLPDPSDPFWDECLTYDDGKRLQELRLQLMRRASERALDARNSIIFRAILRTLILGLCGVVLSLSIKSAGWLPLALVVSSLALEVAHTAAADRAAVVEVYFAMLEEDAQPDALVYEIHEIMDRAKAAAIAAVKL